MTAPITAAGFVGQVDEIQEAKRLSLLGPRFRVASVNDWKPSPDAGVNRQVNLTVGSGQACGVLGTTATTASLTFAPNTGSQSRYDALVATFAWAANSGAGLAAHFAGFRIITGGATPPQVNSLTTLDNTKINQVPGVQYDALISIVRVRVGVGLFSSGDVVDCRTWAGYEGYANTGSSLYLTSLDTQPGSLVRDVSTDIVWSRNASGVWGFEKWAGSDKTKQPMISLHRTSISIPSNATTPTLIGSWDGVVDHGTQGGMSLLTYNSSIWVRCEVPGRVRIDAFARSSLGDSGMSWARVDFPAGGGHYQVTMEDQQQRASGYASAGDLRQPLNGGPIQVAAGDLIGMSIAQLSLTGIACSYEAALTVTYV